MFAAGASSGLMAGAVHRRHRAAAPRRAPATPTWSTASCGPPWPASRSARWRSPSPAAAPTSPGIRTTAVRDGDHYVVNGTKTFITSGVRADFVTTAVRTGGPGHAGSACSSSRRARPASPSTGRWPRWAGTAPTPPSSAYADVRVPVGQPGRRRGHRLRPDRRAVRRRADRAGRARLRHRRAVAGADRGVLPGAARPSAGRWSPTRWCATSWSRCAARSRSRAPTPARWRARHVAGENVVAEACLAKQTACDAATYVCDRAVQLHGGAGYLHGTEVERHYRDARILPIGGGATEVLTDLAARLLGYAS